MSRVTTLIKRPVYALLIIFLLLSGGLYVLQHFSIDLLPGLNYPLINVVTQYPGVSPEDVELLVTRPIELELQGIRGVRRTSSISAMGISQVTVEFSQGFDLVTARQLVSAGLSNLAGTLPPEVHPDLDNLGSRLQQVVGYTFVNPDIPATQLRQTIKYQLVPALQTLSGISRVEVLGGRRAAFTVEPDLQKLRQVHLSVRDLRDALQASNITVSGRYLTENYQDVPIRGYGQVQSPEDVASVYLKSAPDGSPILLQDVATVREGALPEHYSIRADQLPAVAIMVQKQPAYGTPKLAHAVDRKIAGMRSLLPAGTRIHKVYDQSEIIDESIHGVEMEMLLGALLAILVLHYFLRRWKPTWIVAVTIPLSLLMALLLMYVSGFTLNMMTLAALTLAVGMVVDDAIIVMENIERYQEEGQPLIQAITGGLRQIAGADISGTLTTVVVFLPLLFLTGFVGQLVLPFGATIGYTLLASLVLSLIIIPILMHWQGGSGDVRSTPPKGLAGLMALNDRIFDRVMRHKGRIFTVIVLLLVLTAAGVGIFNRAGMLPPLDEGALLIEYVMPPGTSLQESRHIGLLCSGIIRKDPAVESVYLKIGSPVQTYYIETVNRGEFLIKLQPKNRRKRSADQVLADLQSRLESMPGTSFLFHQPTQENIDESFSGLPAFFGITVLGTDQDSLVAYSKKIEAVAGTTKGISNIVNNAKILAPQLQVVPRRDRLAAYHLSASQVMQQLEIGFQGETAGYFIKNQVPVALFLRLSPADRQDLHSLRNYPVRLDSSSTLPLSQLCQISYHDISPKITHLNGRREITVTSGIGGNLFGTVHRLRQKLQDLHLPQGYDIAIRGQYQTLIRTVTSFLWVILSAVILVYLILYLQFNSLWQPLVIILKIPMDFLGAFLALLITRQQVNVSVAIGLLTLVGIAVNNAIVLVDYTNKIRARGTDRLEALREAVHIRTRPILMTGMTTIFGLLPAAIGGNIGSRIHQPFAITLIGGLLVGMFFSLNLIPALYDGLARRFERR